MKLYSFNKPFRVLALVALIISGLAACTPKYLSPGTLVSNELEPQLNTSNTWTVATTQRAGATITVEFQFWSVSPISEIIVRQAIARTTAGVVTRDTSLVARLPNTAAFSKEKQCDTMLITYTVPALTRSTGQTIQINPQVGFLLRSQPNILRFRPFLTGNGFMWNP